MVHRSIALSSVKTRHSGGSAPMMNWNAVHEASQCSAAALESFAHVTTLWAEIKHSLTFFCHKPRCWRVHHMVAILTTRPCWASSSSASSSKYRSSVFSRSVRRNYNGSDYACNQNRFLLECVLRTWLELLRDSWVQLQHPQLHTKAWLFAAKCTMACPSQLQYMLFLWEVWTFDV